MSTAETLIEEAARAIDPEMWRELDEYAAYKDWSAEEKAERIADPQRRYFKSLQRAERAAKVILEAAAKVADEQAQRIERLTQEHRAGDWHPTDLQRHGAFKKIATAIRALSPAPQETPDVR